jgi:hypothetical protein
MGKAGILEGGKGDIMIPNAHIKGTADNYFFENELSAERCLKRYCCICRTNGNGTRNIIAKQDLLNFSTNRLGELLD